MLPNNITPELNFPKISPQIDVSWTLIGIILGVVGLFTNEIEQISIHIRIGILVGIIVVSSVMSPVLRWLFSAIKVSLLRMRYYHILFQQTQLISSELTQTRENLAHLFSLFAKTHAFEILKVMFYEGRLYILVEKKREPKLDIDDQLMVVDAQIGTLMGTFRVTQNRRNDYYAVEDGYVSPLWLGYVRQQKISELEAPPNTYAMIAREGELYGK